jgi:hypothetical protein
MNSAANPETAPLITPSADDVHDRTYQFGKPLTYLSDRQQARLLILRGHVREAGQTR